MRTIELTKGLHAMVDDEDYELVNQYVWFAHHGYAVTKMITGEPVYMHRFLASISDDLQTDHRNANTLDNRRGNLRPATSQQNQRNQRKQQRDTSSIYKGVCWHSQHSKWYAYIYVNKKQKFLGLFSLEIDAAKAYDKAARTLFGEFARLNFPESHEQGVLI